MNRTAVPHLNRRPLTGTWYRALQLQHWNTLLQTVHTRVYPSRFSHGTTANPGFELLYLAENAIVALFEAQAVLGAPMPGGFLSQPRQAWIVINVDVALQEATDLTEVPAQHALATSAQELTGDWRGYQLRKPTTSITQPAGSAPTQELGAALFAAPGLQGFETISAKLPELRTLVVFPQKLLPGGSSRVAFRHPLTGQTLSIP